MADPPFKTVATNMKTRTDFPITASESDYEKRDLVHINDEEVTLRLSLLLHH